MEYHAVMAELEAAGSEKTRAIYRRHGAKDPLFGVSFAKLGELQKRIRVDHALSEALWASGNADARVLATMVADPGRMTPAALQAWAADLDYHTLADCFAKLVSDTAHARTLMERWTRSSEELIGQVGWDLLAHLAMRDPGLDDGFFGAYVEAIESRIQGVRNRVRHAMNMALIAIGIRNPALEARALAAAGRIGKVSVDHGATACRTPDAAEYIARTRAYRAAQAAAKAAPAPKAKPAKKPAARPRPKRGSRS